MKRKTIKKVLFQKLDEWANSIENEEVKKAVRQDTIVSGGAIASMLLGERVKDYDIYFRTMETAKMVAEYYVDKFILERPQYNDTKVKVREIENIKGEQETRISIMVPSQGVAGDNPDNEEEGEPGDTEDETTEKGSREYRPVFLSENAITLSDKIQIVTRFYGEPDQIHRNYDFAHAMNWYSWRDNKLHLDPLALECLLSRTLIYKGSLYPVCSIFRARKFIARGWKISAGDLLKIMWQISELNFKNINVLREQLTGVDALYFQHLIDALEETDSAKLESNYASVIIDKIFNGESTNET